MNNHKQDIRQEEKKIFYNIDDRYRYVIHILLYTIHNIHYTYYIFTGTYTNIFFFGGERGEVRLPKNTTIYF